MALISIKGSTFTASVMLLQLGNFSLLESTSHHKRRILDMKFPANIVVPLLLRWRPSLYRWDSRMLLWKITFFSSLFNISMYFFRTLFAFLLSVRTMGLSYCNRCKCYGDSFLRWKRHCSCKHTKATAPNTKYIFTDSSHPW